MCYVDDLIEGIIRLLHTDHPGPVNLGSPREITMGELATTIIDLTGSCSPIRYIPRPPDDPNHRRPDITLARQLLGWEPNIGLAEGLKRTIAWFTTSLPRLLAEDGHR